MRRQPLLSAGSTPSRAKIVTPCPFDLRPFDLRPFDLRPFDWRPLGEVTQASKSTVRVSDTG